LTGNLIHKVTRELIERRAYRSPPLSSTPYTSQQGGKCVKHFKKGLQHPKKLLNPPSIEELREKSEIRKGLIN
jgi:hypothetical protein